MKSILLAAALLFSTSLPAQSAFDVATIHLSSRPVNFERDGETTVLHGTLHMRDVRLVTCIKWAYHLQRPQVEMPEGADSQHYDIEARTTPDATEDQMRVMMQALLADRFGLRFHRSTKEINAYVVTVSPGGLKKMKQAAQEGEPWHQNSAMGMTARNWAMQDFVTYMSDPLGAPMVDETHLPGRYDFTIDFRPYVDQAAEIHADPQSVLKMTAEGELGLRLTRKKTTIEMLVVDHANTPDEN